MTDRPAPEPLLDAEDVAARYSIGVTAARALLKRVPGALSVGLGSRKRWRVRLADRPAPINRLGHLQVKLSIRGRVFGRLVHRLVLEAFVGPCPLGMEARHVNERDTGNNALANLAWGSKRENYADQVRHGRRHSADPRNVRRRQRRATRAGAP